MWRANTKARVTRQLFTMWFNLVFGPTVKKYLCENNPPLKAFLVLDNTLTHQPNLEEDIVEEFKFIRTLYHSPNTTHILQPMDQQVIANVKKLFTKHQIQRCFEISENTRDSPFESSGEHIAISPCASVLSTCPGKVLQRGR